MAVPLCPTLGDNTKSIIPVHSDDCSDPTRKPVISKLALYNPYMTEQTKNYTGPSTSSPNTKPRGGGRRQLGAYNQARGLNRRYCAFKAFRELGNQGSPDVAICPLRMDGATTGTTCKSNNLPIPIRSNTRVLLKTRPTSYLRKRGGELMPDASYTYKRTHGKSSSSSHQAVSNRPRWLNRHNFSHKHTELSLDGTQRFILTNTGSLTTKQLFTALENTLKNQPLILRSILKVKQIFQPNRRTRFDLWVKDQSSAGLQRALGLDYTGRQILAEDLEKRNLSTIERVTQGMLPRYRLSRWKSYRDRIISKKQSPNGKALHLNQFMTWNINGIQSKLTCLKDLLLKNNVAVAAIQEHLRT
ncbi:hypothetical protein PCASD_25905, partial [Puccinia coronata f. sp. avenae]